MRTSNGVTRDDQKKVNQQEEKPTNTSGAAEQNRFQSEGNAEDTSKVGSNSDIRADRNIRTKKVTFRKSLDSVEIESSDSNSDISVQDGVYHCIPINLSNEEMGDGATPIKTDDKDFKQKEAVRPGRRNALQATTEGISSILSDIESQLRGEDGKVQAQPVANIPFCCTAHQYQYVARGFYTLPHMAPAFVPPPLPMYTPPPAYPCQQCSFPQQPFQVIYPAACPERFVAPSPQSPWFTHGTTPSVGPQMGRTSPVEDAQVFGERGMADGGEVCSKSNSQAGLSIDELSEFLRLLEAVKQEASDDGSEKSETRPELNTTKPDVPEGQIQKHKNLEVEEYDNVTAKEENVPPPKRALPPIYFPKRFLDVIPEEGSDVSDFEVRSSRDFSDTLSDVLSGRGSVILESLSEEDEESRDFSYSETPKPPHSPNIRRSILSEGDSVEILLEEESIRLSQISNCDVGEGSSFDAVEYRSDDENEKTLVEEIKVNRTEPVPQPRLSLIQKEVIELKPEPVTEKQNSCCSPAYAALKEAFDFCTKSERINSFDRASKSGYVRAEPVIIENSDESDAYSVASEPVSESNLVDQVMSQELTHAQKVCQTDRRSLLLTEIPKPVAELSGLREDMGTEEKTVVIFHRDNDDVLLPLPVVTLTNDSSTSGTNTPCVDTKSGELIGSECTRSEDISSLSNDVSKGDRRSFTKLFGFGKEKPKDSSFSFPKFFRSSSPNRPPTEQEKLSEVSPGLSESNQDVKADPEVVAIEMPKTTQLHVIYDSKSEVREQTGTNTGYRGVKSKIEAFKRNLLGKDKDEPQVPKRDRDSVSSGPEQGPEVVESKPQDPLPSEDKGSLSTEQALANTSLTAATPVLSSRLELDSSSRDRSPIIVPKEDSSKLSGNSNYSDSRTPVTSLPPADQGTPRNLEPPVSPNVFRIPPVKSSSTSLIKDSSASTTKDSSTSVTRTFEEESVAPAQALGSTPPSSNRIVTSTASFSLSCTMESTVPASVNRPVTSSAVPSGAELSVSDSRSSLVRRSGSSSKEGSPSSLTKVPPSPELPRRVFDMSFESVDSRSMTPCTVIEMPIHDDKQDDRPLSLKPISMGSMKARQNSFALAKSKSFGSPLAIASPQPMKKPTSFDDMTKKVQEESGESQPQDADYSSHKKVVSELRKFWLEQERNAVLKKPDAKPKWEDAIKVPPPVPKKPRRIQNIEPLSKLASSALARTPLGSEIVKLVDCTVARYSKESATLSNVQILDCRGSGKDGELAPEPGKDNMSCENISGKVFMKDERLPERSPTDVVSKAVKFSSECKAPKPPPRLSSTEVIKRFRYGAFSPPAVRRKNFALQRNASAPSVPGRGCATEDGYLTDSDWRIRDYEARCFSEFDFSSGDDSPLPPIRPSPPCSDLDEKEFILRSRLCQNFPPPTNTRTSSCNRSRQSSSRVSCESINQNFQPPRSYFEGGDIYSPFPPPVPPPPVGEEPINLVTPTHSRQTSLSSIATLEGSYYSEGRASPLRKDSIVKSPPPPPRRYLSQNVFFPSNFPSDSSESGSMFGSLPRTQKKDKNRLKATLLSDWLETTKQEMRLSNSSESSRSRPVSLEADEAIRQAIFEEYRNRVAVDRNQIKGPRY